MTIEATGAQQLADHLRSLLDEGGDHNRLVVSRGDAYLIFVGSRGGERLGCEAVSNDHLPAPAKLTPARLEVLRAGGFAAQPGRRNPSRGWDARSEAEIAAIAGHARELLEQAYGVAADEPLALDLALGDREETSNLELVRSMKKLARLRDPASRQGVYRGVLASELLLLLDREAAADPHQHVPHVVERLQGYPVIAAFTDWDALRLWEPRGWPYAVVPGHRIVRLAEARRVGSLLINPRGEIGGELLMNELAGLADAARRLYAE